MIDRCHDDSDTYILTHYVDFGIFSAATPMASGEPRPVTGLQVLIAWVKIACHLLPVRLPVRITLRQRDCLWGKGGLKSPGATAAAPCGPRGTSPRGRLQRDRCRVTTGQAVTLFGAGWIGVISTIMHDRPAGVQDGGALGARRGLARTDHPARL